MKNNSAENTEENDREQTHRHNVLEIIFTVISGLLLIALLGYLGYHSTQQQSNPDLTIKAMPSSMGREFQTLPVEVENFGDHTAQDVNIRGVAAEANGTAIEAETSIDWVPGHSRKKAELVFSNSADLKDVRLTITGYAIP